MVAIVDDMLLVYIAGHVTVDCVHNCIESCYGSIISMLNLAASTVCMYLNAEKILVG